MSYSLDPPARRRALPRPGARRPASRGADRARPARRGVAGAWPSCAAGRDCKLIQLVTPTTPPDARRRIVRVVDRASSTVVSVAGITGERDRLPPELLDQLAWLRGETDLPLCVGFGVSKPEHVRDAARPCDGVIVGSALVRLLEGPGSVEEKAGRLAGLARSLAGALAES